MVSFEFICTHFTTRDILIKKTVFQSWSMFTFNWAGFSPHCCIWLFNLLWTEVFFISLTIQADFIRWSSHRPGLFPLSPLSPNWVVFHPTHSIYRLELQIKMRTGEPTSLTGWILLTFFRMATHLLSGLLLNSLKLHTNFGKVTSP